ncbi:MAG: hypothetical protein GF364_04755 [Candidatus Lokiarchaeota archaeon]|nr:hypothetical protein [Candidatus Lokiarchaeota archaeon]
MANKKDTFELLSKIVVNFLDRLGQHDKSNKSEIDREYHHIYNNNIDYPFLMHYAKEIIRYWNKLNYVLKKTLRSLNLKIDKKEMPLFLYITYRWSEENAKQSHLAKELEIIAPHKYSKYSQNKMLLYYQQLQTFSWDIALKNKQLQEKFSIQYAIPSFFIQKLSRVMQIDEIKEQAVSMDNQAVKGSFSVRINAHNTTLGEFISYLVKKKIRYTKDENFQYVLHLNREYKSQIIDSEFYREARVVLQDKASMLVVELLENDRNDNDGINILADLCAAPGMKSILSIEKYKNRCIAFDKVWNRLLDLKHLGEKHLKDSAIHPLIINCDSTQLPIRNLYKFDNILLDAPCTGSGNFSANPELKWRQGASFLKENILLQQKLLRIALKIVKDDGVILYSVCSLYPEEGEMQIQSLNDKIEFYRIPSWLDSPYGINQEENEKIKGIGRMFPKQNGTNGFFYAKFRKKKMTEL